MCLARASAKMPASPAASVFQIDDNDDDDNTTNNNTDDLADPADPPLDAPACTAAEQRQSLLSLDTAERVAGTAGCCGALVLLFGCLCCGLCEREFTDTYRHHTLCGRWCPV
jgi:hypothetical protein